MTIARKYWRRTLVALTLPLFTFAVSCSSAEDDSAAQATQGAEESHSAESTESGEAVTKPQRIASLSSDATSLLAELVDHELIVASPATPGSKPVGETALPDGVHADPEQVLALNPDLVVLTERHGSEGSPADLLANSGVKVHTFKDSDWSSIDSLMKSMKVLGELTGEKEKAQELSAKIGERRDEIVSALNTKAKPRVLLLMTRGGKKMIMAPSTMASGLVKEAGGELISEAEGMRGSAPADPERIAALAPDVILVEDFRGQGKDAFADLLDQPAIAELGARVELISPATTGASAGSKITTGLEDVAEKIGTKRH